MSLEFSPVRVLACRRGDPRTLTPGPRTPYGPSPRTTLQTGPGTPPTDPFLRTPHKKTIIKNDNQRFFFFFYCYAAQILQILLLRWNKDLRTSKKTDKLANLCFPYAFAAIDCLRHFVRLISPRSALVNIRRKALSTLMIFTQGRTVFCFYITLKWYLKLEIIYESASLFNLKEKKILMWRARGFEPMPRTAMEAKMSFKLSVFFEEVWDESLNTRRNEPNKMKDATGGRQRIHKF